jgi:hypothetical protein
MRVILDTLTDVFTNFMNYIVENSYALSIK